MTKTLVLNEQKRSLEILWVDECNKMSLNFLSMPTLADPPATPSPQCEYQNNQTEIQSQQIERNFHSCEVFFFYLEN